MFRLMIISVIVLWIFNSCTEKIEIELDSSYTRLVVYGEVTDLKGRSFVKLNKTSDYLSGIPAPAVSNAVVEIIEGGESIFLQEDLVTPGLYKFPSDFKGTADQIYQLKLSDIDINEDGINESYSAQTKLKPVNSIDSITLKYTANSFFSGWEIQVWAWDPGNIKNYYSFKAYKNNKILTDTLDEYIVIDDLLFNGNFTYGITALFLNDEEESEKVIPGDTVTLEMNSITEEYYNFILEAQTEIRPSTPLFSGPPANISSNISNGALGIFTAYSAASQTTVVPDYPD